MHTLKSLLPLASILALLSASEACAKILDIPDDPQLVPTGPWRCLKEPGQAVMALKDTAVVRVHACNFVSTNCSTSISGLDAALCNKRDVNCSAPIRTGIHDTNGDLMFEVSTGGAAGFDGYLQISGPAELCTNETVFGPAAGTLCALAQGCDPKAPDDHCKIPTFAPSLLFFNPPIKTDSAEPILLPLVPTASVQPILQAAGGKFDPTTGFIFITALDCDGIPAPGVNYNISNYQNLVTELYIDNGVVSRAATQTDPSGLGGFLGVPSGFVSVEAALGMDPMMRIKIGEIGVQVAPFTITYSAVVPP